MEENMTKYLIYLHYSDLELELLLANKTLRYKCYFCVGIISPVIVHLFQTNRQKIPFPKLPFEVALQLIPGFVSTASIARNVNQFNRVGYSQRSGKGSIMNTRGHNVTFNSLMVRTTPNDSFLDGDQKMNINLVDTMERLLYIMSHIPETYIIDTGSLLEKNKIDTISMLQEKEVTQILLTGANAVGLKRISFATEWGEAIGFLLPNDSNEVGRKILCFGQENGFFLDKLNSHAIKPSSQSYTDTWKYKVQVMQYPIYAIIFIQ